MAGTKHLRVDSKVPVLCKVVWPQRTVYVDEVAEGSLLYIAELRVHSSDWYDNDRCIKTCLLLCWCCSYNGLLRGTRSRCWKRVGVLRSRCLSVAMSDSIRC
jgi:hypothetical protein